MNVLHDRPASNARALRGFAFGPSSSPIHPATMARVELLRRHIDDTVQRAQHNLELRRAAAPGTLERGDYVFARGHGVESGSSKAGR